MNITVLWGTRKIKTLLGNISVLRSKDELCKVMYFSAAKGSHLGLALINVLRKATGRGQFLYHTDVVRITDLIIPSESPQTVYKSCCVCVPYRTEL